MAWTPLRIGQGFLPSLVSDSPTKCLPSLQFWVGHGIKTVFRQMSFEAGVALRPDKMDQVLGDIEEAYSFLSAAFACRFLVGLWTVPGVRDEINRFGGWSKLETYAKISWKHQLWQLCPDGAHLVVFCNFDACF